MPKEPAKKRNQGRNDRGTKPRQFRLGDETLAQLDRIAAHFSRDSVTHSRADAVRIAAARLDAQLTADEGGGK